MRKGSMPIVAANPNSKRYKRLSGRQTARMAGTKRFNHGSRPGGHDARLILPRFAALTKFGIDRKIQRQVEVNYE
jgi:hypothetical protein